MKKMRYLISIPKTIFFNFTVFPFKIAIKLPVLVGYNVKLANIHRDCIQITSKITRFMIKINAEDGSDGVNYGLKKSGYFDVKEEGKVTFNGKANFSSGVSMRVDSGKLYFGSNFVCNKNCFFSCSKKIAIGDNVLMGWNVKIRDSDGHRVYDINKKDINQNEDRPVLIGNHVWVGANVDILKGVEIPDDCIVGYNSCVTKKFKESNCILVGYPAKVVKTNVNWII